MKWQKIDCVHVCFFFTHVYICEHVLTITRHTWVGAPLKSRPINAKRVELGYGEIVKYFRGALWLMCVVSHNKELWRIHWKLDGNSGVSCSLCGLESSRPCLRATLCVDRGDEVLWRVFEGVARQQGGQLGVMSAGLKSCLLSVPGPDKNRQAGLGRPAWSCHHGHLLTAIITSTPTSHRYSIQTQLRAPHVPLQPAITNTPAVLTRLPFFLP